MPPQSPSPMPAVAIRAHTATTALGRGRDAQLQALRARRSGLRRNDFGGAVPGGRLDTWIGRVDGLEHAPLPPALAGWECRNNRLAWLALQQDGIAAAVAAARARHGAERIAVVMGTSTASIGESEDAYAGLVPGDDGVATFAPARVRPIVHTPVIEGKAKPAHNLAA